MGAVRNYAQSETEHEQHVVIVSHLCKCNTDQVVNIAIHSNIKAKLHQEHPNVLSTTEREMFINILFVVVVFRTKQAECSDPRSHLSARGQIPRIPHRCNRKLCGGNNLKSILFLPWDYTESEKVSLSFPLDLMMRMYLSEATEKMTR